MHGYWRGRGSNIRAKGPYDPFRAQDDDNAVVNNAGEMMIEVTVAMVVMGVVMQAMVVMIIMMMLIMMQMIIMMMVVQMIRMSIEAIQI